MSRKNLLAASAAFIVLLAGIFVIIGRTHEAPAQNYAIHGNVDVWLTTTNQKNLLKRQEPLLPKDSQAMAQDSKGIAITVDPGKTYQQMDGFGASMTDASAWLISNALDEKKRQELMEKLFDKEKGIGISFLRQPMGASDFATKLYTYDDVPEGQVDPDLAHFSIDHDKGYIIPLIKDALRLRPSLKVMASPWSPPAWMKTSKDLIGGYLNTDYYEAYASYFTRFIKAYEAEGIPVYAITPQNEPMYVPTEYPGMKMDFSSQISFINDYLGPAFEKNNIHTKIIAYDHNWDNLAYPLMVLQQSSKYVAGTAWHCYGGNHSAMTKIHNKYPDKDVWLTEASGGQWVPPFNEAFADQMMHVIRSTRNYSKSVVWWNIALDQNNGPTVLHNSTCRGIVKIDTSTGQIAYNVDYYTLGHISKFVDPGAFRIESTNYENQLETTAFKNPDGSLVLIVQSRYSDDKELEIRYGTITFQYNLRGKAAATFTWK